MLVPRVRLPAGAFAPMFDCCFTLPRDLLYVPKKLGLVFGASFAARQATALRHQKVVPRGLEPRTLRLLAVRSNQLSYETRCW